MLSKQLEITKEYKGINKFPNKIICENCEIVLDRLETASIDLIYLDPPFFSNRSFYSRSKQGRTYTFDDTWNNNIEEYISFLTKIILQCHRILSDSGSLYLHCDWHASHYLKIALDRIFGYKQFRNEIVWRRHNSHNDTKQGAKILGRIHDVILFYSKTDKYTWIPAYQKYSTEYIEKVYKYTEPETNRKYALGDLSGPGGKSKGNPYYKFLGVTRYWRYSKKRMQELWSTGRIFQSSKGKVPLLKRYLDEMQGTILQDIWEDISPVRNKNSAGYPTEKPIKLLERIIEMSSNNNDIVLDPFCGSGTTLIAASNLGRRFIGIDKNENACKLATTRLTNRIISINR